MALTNADFRSLLNTADQSILGGNLDKNGGKKRAANDVENSERKEKRKMRYIQIQKRKLEKSQKSTEDESSKYRDRADERRKCKDDFYQRVAEELNELKDRSIEESKYLGGDVEHTHLVKGLDFALLNKVKGDLKVAPVGKVDEISDRSRLERGGFKLKSIEGKKLYKAIFQELHPHHYSYHDKLKHVEKNLLRGNTFKGNTETFLPGRTCYSYDVNMAMGADDIPTVIFNSKEDCPRPANGIVMHIHSKLFNELEEALRWHAQNRKKLRSEREARRPGNLQPAGRNVAPTAETNGTLHARDDDDDIFSGVGKFVASELAHVNLSQNSADKSQTATELNNSNTQPTDKTGMDIIRDEQGMDLDDDNEMFSNNNLATYSGGDSNNYGATVMHDYNNHAAIMKQEFGININSNQNNIDPDAAPYIPINPKKVIKSGTTTVEQDKGFHSVYKRDEQALRKRGDEDEREKDPAYISDTYMECYPGFGAEVSFEAYDSDDEEDRSKMDMGRLKQFGARRRDDFASKEDWEHYQSKKEALPKAAFQYGRKMDDNRVTRRKKKLNPEEEWKRIEKMIGDHHRSERNVQEEK